MARKLRVEYEGAIYHVTCRLVGSWSDGDRELFRDDNDRWRFLRSLEKRVEFYGVRLHQYVLMANHFSSRHRDPAGQLLGIHAVSSDILYRVLQPSTQPARASL